MSVELQDAISSFVHLLFDGRLALKVGFQQGVFHLHNKCLS